MILLVTGTDTGVGKTIVAGALALRARAEGLAVSVLKPVETGCREGRAADAELLARCAEADAEECVLWRLRDPLAPAVAAEREGTSISLQRIASRIASIDEGDRLVIVEGAGGLCTPITWTEGYLELARIVGAQVVLVARAGLGTLSQARLCLDALHGAGVRVRGVLLNASTPEHGLAEATNEAALRKMAPGVRVETVPYIAANEDYARCLAVGDRVGWLLQ